jgi:hypothetical protein
MVALVLRRKTVPMSGQLSVAHRIIIPAKIEGVDMLNSMKSSAPEKDKNAAANVTEVMGTVQPHDQAWARPGPTTKGASCIGSDMSIVGKIEWSSAGFRPNRRRVARL